MNIECNICSGSYGWIGRGAKKKKKGKFSNINFNQFININLGDYAEMRNMAVLLSIPSINLV